MAITGRQSFFRIIRNTKSLPGARRMIHYIAFRSRELAYEQKGGFDRNLDQADVDRFCRSLEHRLTAHPKVPVAFHTLFSLPREEAERAGIFYWKPFIREVMSRYEAERQIKLEWFASFHDSKTHPHCHVVIKAVYTNQDGQERRLRFNKEDLKEMRKIAGRLLAHRRWIHQAPERAARVVRSRLYGIKAGIDWIREQIRRQRREMEQREWEEAHERWLRDE